MTAALSQIPAKVDSSGIQLTGQWSIDGKRALPSLSTLTQMVERELALQITQKLSFTSYTITLLLRQQYSSLEIEHLRNSETQGIKTVQELVHDIMPHLMARYSIPYITEDHLWGANGIDDPNGRTALTYVPYNALSHGAQTAQTTPSISVGTDDQPQDDGVQMAAVIGNGGNVTIFVAKNDKRLRQPVNVTEIEWPTDLKQMLTLPATTSDETVIE